MPHHPSRTSHNRGFTLPELLIALALIALLVAIALPGFREGRTRSKISGARSDMRRLAVALEGYRVDYRVYPKCNNFSLAGALLSPDQQSSPAFRILERLTTPVAYMQDSFLADPFDPLMRTGSIDGATGDFTPVLLGENPNSSLEGLYKYVTPGPTGIQDVESSYDIASSYFVLFSSGPDRIYENLGGLLHVTATDRAILAHVYDPTNGTNSPGSLFRIGGVTTGERKSGALFFDLAGR
jgi:prepilin-type N-terminal cleavage/methylation domain-containing protein